MKKTILIYSAIVYILCFILNLYELFIIGFKFETLMLVFFSCFCLLPIYFIFEEKYIKQAYTLLWITNILQAFSLIFIGITCKILVGPDLSLYFINAEDFIARFSLKLFNLYLYLNFVKNGSAFGLGINFIHLLLFVYFYFESNKLKKKV